VFEWSIILCDSAECKPPIALETFSISAPERLTIAPDLPLPIAATLGDVAQLVSAQVNEADGKLDVHLLWQPLRTPDTRYRVFVHLLDPQGNLMAQSDAEPANWQRPTTGWLPDEFVLDTHMLSVPTGFLPGSRLVAGLYDPATGLRLTSPDGEDAVTFWSVE
jgi:hypothetical protein